MAREPQEAQTKPANEPDRSLSAYRERRCTLDDGTEVLIRPIRAIDCSACSTMLTACSEESLYSRYERVVSESPDALARELCVPNPQCERTLVGEIHHGSFPTIIGIAQLITDPGHTVAEYAVLIADVWQNQGLGSAFTDACLQVAHDWGVPRVVAEFLPSNMRMIRILEKRRFDMSRDLREHVVSGQKLVGPGDAVGSSDCTSPIVAG
jgi:acetyltransferase